ncbi:unnamed protein product, partial [Cuscuta epithymum]
MVTRIGGRREIKLRVWQPIHLARVLVTVEGGVRTHAISPSLASTNGSETSSKAVVNSLNDLSTEQVQALLKLINTEPSSSDRMSGICSTLSWIIDTGASRHVTDDSKCLTNCNSIRACPVGLPDGRVVAAVMEGRAQLSHTLALDHVLYVPGLNCHLISVSQLIDQLSCKVIFTNLFCAIQDRCSRTLIGAGERRDGLYIFRGVPAVHTVHKSVLSDFELWHRRLGHPSDRVLKLLPHIITSTSKKTLNKTCEVCPQAKHVRDSFPVSDNKASCILELIHCDLWGPYKTPSTCDAIYFLTLVDDFSR